MKPNYSYEKRQKELAKKKKKEEKLQKKAERRAARDADPQASVPEDESGAPDNQQLLETMPIEGDASSEP
ncbi:MAG: hypothetical protein WHT81_00820 [Rectinemataceae bacterium]|nr:hypothetical protein [Spirochaetaceae bacterium]